MVGVNPRLSKLLSQSSQFCLSGLGALPDVSPATHVQSELSHEALASSIRAITEDARYRMQAQTLQAEIQAEDGVAKVVVIAESYLREAVEL